MKYFEKSVLINCSIEELFNFHLDTKNLRNITPPDTKVVLENPNFVAKEGEVLKLKTTKFFINTSWEVKIAKLEFPNILVDIALKSPFKYWEHSHVFEQIDGKCLMKDVVKYELPFGVLGSLFNFFIKNELNNMFNYRHKITKKILEDKK